MAVQPKTLRLNRREPAVVRYALSQPAQVTLELWDEQGTLVRQMTAAQPNGAQQLSWDGKDNAGLPVPTGAYRYVLQATAGPQRATHDPSAYSGGEEVKPMAFTFDKINGQLRWRLPQAARVRLRVGLEGLPHLRTLKDWEPMEAGAHETTWDGKDISSEVRFIDHPHLSMKLSAFALPDNVIIVADSPQLRPESPAPLGLAAPQAPYLHARHHRAACQDVALEVEFPQHEQRDAQGRVRVGGQVPVRVTLPTAQAPAFVNQRFEAVIFEDLTVLFEEEEALNPFTFVWDTGRLPAGPHLLTINVLSYDDHFGVATVPVVVEAKRP